MPNHSSRGVAEPASDAEAGSMARSVTGGDACLRTRRASMVSQQTKTAMVRGCFTLAAFSTYRVAGDSSDSTRGSAFRRHQLRSAASPALALYEASHEVHPGEPPCEASASVTAGSDLPSRVATASQAVTSTECCTAEGGPLL